MGSLLRVSRGQSRGICGAGLRAGLGARVSAGEPASKLIQVVGRTQFFAVVGPRAPFSCWMLARDHSPYLEVAQVLGSGPSVSAVDSLPHSQSLSAP